MPRLIKRYENRKLYDTEAKAYVRLEEIAALIRRGEEVQVIDNATGADITAATLAKVIAETVRPPLPQPSEVLHQLLRWGEQSWSSGKAQLQAAVERAVERLLEKHGPLREFRQELAELRARLEALERALGSPPPVKSLPAKEENDEHGGHDGSSPGETGTGHTDP